MKKWILILLCFVGALQAEGPQELKQRVLEVLPTLEGWCSKEKASAFIDMVLNEQPKVWVEIGVFGGSSLFPVLSAMKFIGQGVAIAIDPWDKVECIRHFDPIKDKTDLKWWGNLNINSIYESFQKMLTTHELSKYCTIYRATSESACNEISFPVDVLYIDGNHNETVTVKDVKLYLPRVRSGGYIWLNDSRWVARQKAIDLLSEYCEFVTFIDNENCILFKKR